MFSVGDLYLKLKSFQSSMQSTPRPLYFAKVDVKAAFDTIPQDSVLQLMSSVPSEEEYRIAKHVAMKPSGGSHEGDGKSKPIHKWTALAKPVDDVKLFNDELESKLAVERRDTVFVENVVSQVRDTDDLLRLLAEHIKYNMVKIGKKYYRQKEGIPQGSVLSSLLCNYFYADLEMRHLHFLDNDGSLLLRLIDDFLLITTEPSHAKKFLQIMHDGLPEYGVRVNPDKTLVNFEATINGKKVPRLVGSRKFPYCGSFIDTKTLNLSKDRDRNKSISMCIHLFNEILLTRIAITDSLTVEYSRIPGRTFHRKALSECIRLTTFPADHCRLANVSIRHV
jgi:telomerase reverse transcriptase